MIVAIIFIFVFLVLGLVSAVIAVKKIGMKIAVTVGLMMVVLSGGITYYSYNAYIDYQLKEQTAKKIQLQKEIEDMEKKHALLKKSLEEEQKRVTEERKLFEEERKILEKERKNQSVKKESKDHQVQLPENPAIKQRKVKEWNKLGYELGSIEAKLQQDLAKIDDEIKKVKDDYKAEKITSYEEIKITASLGVEKQDLILKAQNDKRNLLKNATLITDEEKKYDMALLERRQSQAEREKERYLEILKQAEEGSDVLKSI